MTCTDLKKPNPYGVNLKITGFSEDDLELINSYMKSYSFEKGMDPALIEAAANTCGKDFVCDSYLCSEKEVCVEKFTSDKPCWEVDPMPVEPDESPAVKRFAKIKRFFEQE